MDRGSLGFIVSRVMSVVALMTALAELRMALIYAQILSHATREAPTLSLVVAAPYCVAGLTLLIAIVLWIRADLFAGTASTDPKSDLPPISDRDLRRTLFSAIGLYFLVLGIDATFGDFGTIWQRHLFDSSDKVGSLAYLLPRPDLWYHVIELVVGGCILWLNSPQRFDPNRGEGLLRKVATWPRSYE